MAQTSPTPFSSSISATLAVDDASGNLVIASQKKDDFFGAAIAPVVGLFNGGSSVGVGMGHTVGTLGLAALAMYAENKTNLVEKVLPSGN